MFSHIFNAYIVFLHLVKSSLFDNGNKIMEIFSLFIEIKLTHYSNINCCSIIIIRPNYYLTIHDS